MPRLQRLLNLGWGSGYDDMRIGLSKYMFNGTAALSRIGLVLAIFSLLASCGGENTPDCFQKAGNLVRVEVALDSFDRMTVFENIEVILDQGPEQRVEIETGEFLLNEVSAEVEDSRLILRNNNGCNLFRDYGITKVYVTTPDLAEIRSSTGFPIRSASSLAFTNLRLISESFANTDSETTDGSFELEVDTQSLTIVVNGIAFFDLRGSTERLNIQIAAGDSRVEAEALTAQNVVVDHRGSNDIRISPQQSLSGVIRGYGDVVSFNRPPLVDIEVLFRGQLIFVD